MRGDLLTGCRLSGAVLACLVLASSSCSTAPAEAPAGARSGCTAATIDDLWNDPRAFDGRIVCVSGFLRRMVPYGEETAEIFRTPEEAEDTHSQHRLHIGVRMSMRDQARISRYSMHPVRVRGRFEFDEGCLRWGGPSMDERCGSHLPMALRGARITFPDGWKFP